MAEIIAIFVVGCFIVYQIYDTFQRKEKILESQNRKLNYQLQLKNLGVTFPSHNFKGSYIYELAMYLYPNRNIWDVLTQEEINKFKDKIVDDNYYQFIRDIEKKKGIKIH